MNGKIHSKVGKSLKPRQIASKNQMANFVRSFEWKGSRRWLSSKPRDFIICIPI